YASFANSSVLIGAAIQNLLGLDVVDQLDKDLQVYERRKRTQDKDDLLRAQIDAAGNELRELRARSDLLAQERAHLRTHKLDPVVKALAKVDEEFRKLGGALYEQRAEIEKQRDDADSALRASAGALRDLAAGPLPLALVRDLLESAASRDHDEEESRRA